MITETSITDKEELLIEFECSAKDIDVIKSSITVEPDTPSDDLLDDINNAAYNILTPIVSAKETTEKRKNEDKIKEDKCKVLKATIDEAVGKEKPVKKPEKK